MKVPPRLPHVDKLITVQLVLQLLVSLALLVLSEAGKLERPTLMNVWCVLQATTALRELRTLLQHQLATITPYKELTLKMVSSFVHQSSIALMKL